MRCFLVALLFILSSVNSLFAKVYPADGPLFDISSPQCAVGRPLLDVLNELSAKSDYLISSQDYMTIETSSGVSETYRQNNLDEGRFQWPSITQTDSFMYVSHDVHDLSVSDVLDTTVVFGVSFTRNSDISKCKVKTLWYKHIINDSSSDTYQTKSEAIFRSSPNFVCDTVLSQADFSPAPNKTYHYTIPMATFWNYGNFYSSDEEDEFDVKVGVNIASFQTKGNRNVSTSSGTNLYSYDRFEYYVGTTNYCPIIEFVYDTLCRADLPGKYNTKLTHSGADTLMKTQTWYGADSMTILRLVVNEPSFSEADSFRCSNEVTEKNLVTSTVTYSNAAGCDSVVTYNITLYPVLVVNDVYDTLCRADLLGAYETALTQSGLDTLSTTKTWYGADSLVVLHLLVNEPTEAVVDSVCYSSSVTDTTYQTLTDVLVNAAGCDSVVTYNLKIIPLNVPVIPDKFFTPNGDGISDVWNIQNINLYKNYTVCIFNRNGKKLMTYKGNFYGWDGCYNGNPQPSTDYWFSISIDESDKELYGHFTLIR